MAVWSSWIDCRVLVITVDRVAVAIEVLVHGHAINAIAVLIDVIAKVIICPWMDDGVARSAVIGIEAAVAVKVLQRRPGADAANGGEQGEGQQQRGGTHRHILADRAGGAQRVAVIGKLWLVQSPHEPLKVAVKSPLSVSGPV